MFYGNRIFLEAADNAEGLKILKQLAEEFLKKYNAIRKQYKINPIKLYFEKADSQYEDNATDYSYYFGGYSELIKDPRDSIYWSVQEELITEEQEKEIYNKLDKVAKETRDKIKDIKKETLYDIRLQETDYRETGYILVLIIKDNDRAIVDKACKEVITYIYNNIKSVASGIKLKLREPYKMYGERDYQFYSNSDVALSKIDSEKLFSFVKKLRDTKKEAISKYKSNIDNYSIYISTYISKTAGSYLYLKVVVSQKDNYKELYKKDENIYSPVEADCIFSKSLGVIFDKYADITTKYLGEIIKSYGINDTVKIYGTFGKLIGSKYYKNINYFSYNDGVIIGKVINKYMKDESKGYSVSRKEVIAAVKTKLSEKLKSLENDSDFKKYSIGYRVTGNAQTYNIDVDFSCKVDLKKITSDLKYNP